MKYALSTNWNNHGSASGRAMAAEAHALGFEALELGFSTTAQQAAEIRAADILPIGSIHAFCPVPLSAPAGHPELYMLASFDEETRKMAHLQVVRNIRFAAEMGAEVVVLHAGRVMCRRFPAAWNMRRRVKRGAKMTAIFRAELAALAEELEKNRVILALENLPYLEGYPGEWEWKDLACERVRPWFDTGHDYVRHVSGWKPADGTDAPLPVGLHINDSKGGDDHLPPGEGQVDFKALKGVAQQARHLVFEPNGGVTAERLAMGLAYLKELWG